MSCSNCAPSGRVQVDVRERVPRVHEPQHRLHLGRIRLRVVTIQVEVLRGSSPSHLLGPRWFGRFQRPNLSVAVDVEDRDEHQHLPVQRAFRGAVLQRFTQGEEARVLAVRFLRRGYSPATQQYRQALLGRRRFLA